MRIRNPTPLGTVSGPGVVPAHKNFPMLEERMFTEISFQLETDSHAIIGYADMDPKGGQGVLHHLFGQGDRFDVRLETGERLLNLGDFGVHLDSESDRVSITARW